MSEPGFAYDAPDPKPKGKAVKDGPMSPLDKLRARARERVEKPNVYIEVPTRPGIFLEINPNFGQERLKGWRKGAGEATRDGIDGVKLSAMIVGGTTVSIEIDDEKVCDENGTPLTFASQEIQEMFGVSRSLDAVKAMFGNDFNLEATSLAILEQAGLGDDVKTDPTRTP